MPNVKKWESETKEILLDFLHVAGMIAFSGGHVPSVAFLDRDNYERICFERKQWKVRRALSGWKKQKLLLIKNRGDRIQLGLTDRGKLEVLKIYTLRRKTLLPRGEYCLVSFDIPESTRRTRHAVRQFLKEAEFEQVHRSLWRTRRDVVAPMKEFIHSLKAGDWIKVFRARDG